MRPSNYRKSILFMFSLFVMQMLQYKKAFLGGKNSKAGKNYFLRTLRIYCLAMKTVSGLIQSQPAESLKLSLCFSSNL